MSAQKRSLASVKRRFALTMGVILVFAFAIRIAVRAASGSAFFWKNSYLFYYTLAHSLANGDGYSALNGHPTAFRVPFYPIFIAATTQGRHDFWALLIAQALVSTGTVACAAALAGRFFGRGAALTAAALAALYPYYVWHDTSLQETGLLTFLTAFATVLLFATQQSRSLTLAASTGLVLGLAILTRSIVLPFAVFAAAWLIVTEQSRHALGTRIATALICGAAIVTTLSPWLIRNHGVTGRWALSTEFGAAVYYGNNPHTFDFYPRQTIDLSAAAARRALTADDRSTIRAFGNDEVAWGDWFQRRGMDYIMANPGRFLIGAIRKNLAAFGVLPSPRHDWKTDLIQGGAYGIIFALALVGLWQTRARWREFVPVYANFILFAGITGVLWAHSSHRAFLDVYLIVFAASVLVAMVPKIRAAFPSVPARRRA
jgi:4-amino-4-deoxy-L-arabinose transferase-like glycosyltransferase